jgi:glycosyltransferase involved in cell wall biosynthesis
MPRLAFVTSHPIQYQVPVFRLLAAEDSIDLTVLFSHLPDAAQQGDGFGVGFQWDVPLLDGYPYQVLQNVARVPSVTSFAGCDTPGIGRVLREGRFDAVVVNGWVVKSCLQALRACRRLGIPCLVRGEANLLRPRPWWKHWLHRRLVRRYAACLYIGQQNRTFYRRHGVPDDRLFFAPYCVENDRFAAACEESERRVRARQRWGVAVDRTCFVSCGKLQPKKHPVELIEAFGAATRAGAAAHLLVVGDGQLRGDCERLVRAGGFPVTFAGFLNQSEVVDAYLAADCLVLPSDHGETWGLVVNEAMACGRPAIVSDQAGCAVDLIREGQTGTCFPFGRWDILAHKLMGFARTDAPLQTMGQQARQHIAQYSPKAAAAGIVQAVSRCIGGPVHR